MIKHRFMVSAADAEIFAAIPSENHLLRWKRWRRAPDWPAVRELAVTMAATIRDVRGHWEALADGYEVIGRVETPAPLAESAQQKNEAEIRRMRLAQAAEVRIFMGTCDDVAAEVEVISHADASIDVVMGVTGEGATFDACVKALADVGMSLHADRVMATMRESIANVKTYLTFYGRLMMRESVDGAFPKDAEFTDEEKAKLRDFTRTLYEAHDVLLAIMGKVTDAYEFALGVCNTAVELLKKHHTPGPEVECPPGLPFAVYTVEIEGGDVINVVEGQAWIDTSVSEKTGRDFLEERPATEKEKRVAEILSQMLTERSLNPHAATRVPIREVDGKHAAQQRAAEERDVKAGTPKIRTIKFVATPPRYLREAAEVILHSHRRAHWVVGHWRNQAFGEGHTKRKQTWIHPHIRGLGEAGSTAAKVVAPRKETP